MLTLFVFLIKACGIAICIFMIYHILTRKFINPYKLIFLFGKKGSGKSTLLAKLTAKHLRRGWTVYSTECPHSSDDEKYYDFTFVPDKGSLNYINPSKIFEYNFPRRSCILIDEVSLIWDNRDFKHMDKRVIEWFRYQRKHGCRVYFFSQTFDIDKKLRDLADEMYLVNKYFRVLVVASHIVRKPVVVHPGPESPARIDDDMIVDGPLMTFFGGKIFAWIPYWAKRYDTNAINVTVRREEESRNRHD